MSENVIRSTGPVFCDGPCPFLTCLETGPHEHDVCPDCSAVRFGNIGCRTCILAHSEFSEETRAVLLGIMVVRDADS